MAISEMNIVITPISSIESLGIFESYDIGIWPAQSMGYF